MKKLLITLMTFALCTSQMHAMQMETAKVSKKITKKERSCADVCCCVAKTCCYLGALYYIISLGQCLSPDKNISPKAGDLWVKVPGPLNCDCTGGVLLDSSNKCFLEGACRDSVAHSDEKKRDECKDKYLYSETISDRAELRRILIARQTLNDPEYAQGAAEEIIEREGKRSACRRVGYLQHDYDDYL